jgi:diguanylate cyclase (GGDEF)-like protein
LKKLLSFFMAPIPKDLFPTFQKEMDQVTFQRGRLVSIAIIAIECIMMILSLLLHGTMAFESPNKEYFSMYVIMLVVMIAYQFMQPIVTRLLVSNRIAGVIWVLVFTWFILEWSAGITFLDVKNGGQHTVYIVALLAISVITLFKPYASMILYISAHVPFVIVLILYGSRGNNLFGDLVNTSIMAVLSWLAARLLYTYQAKFWLNRHTIEIQNKELEGINIKLEEANREMSRLYHTDALTGTFNRFKLVEVLENEWDRCKRHKLPISVIMLDVDYFKQFNDQYGHLEGDSCIIRVAEVMKTHAKRASEIVARFGGDEFLILLPHVDSKRVAEIAEQVRKSVELLMIPNEASPKQKFITVSLGTASCIPDTAHSVDDFIRWADIALYQAKNQGRNRVANM